MSTLNPERLSVIERFQQIAAEPRFQGWPMVSEYEVIAEIPFFGQAIKYQLLTGNGVEDYVSIVRHFGWSVALGITEEQEAITIVQWKPGMNRAGWELPPGGIGRIAPDATYEEILGKTQEVYLRETGYGRGRWDYLGHVLIESGKYRGASPNDHGLPAHMFLATELERIQDARNPNPNEIIETLMVPVPQLNQMVDSGLFVETSALSCVLLSLRRLNLS